MAKRALFAAAVFISLCLPLFARPTDHPVIDKSLNNSVLRFVSLTLSDAQRFSFSSAFTWTESTTPDFLPALNIASATAKPPKATASPIPNDSSKEVADVRRHNPFEYVHGEVGGLYGTSTGKHSVQVEQGYFIGEVGNDKVQISVGGFYENSSGRFSRFGR